MNDNKKTILFYICKQKVLESEAYIHIRACIKK